MAKIEVPDRVVFLNIKDGNAFFDCTPYEARTAINLIKEMREGGDTMLRQYRDLKREIEEAKEMALTKVTQEKTVQCNKRATAAALAEGFRMIEENDERVSHIFMNAHDYADVRLFERDCIDPETNIYKLRLGVMAYLWGASVIVSSDFEKGKPVFLAYDNPKRRFVGRLILERNEDYQEPPPQNEAYWKQVASKVDVIMDYLKLLGEEKSKKS